MTAATGERLDATFAALADPTRRAIVSRLAVGDATVNELAEPFDLSLPGISKHLKVLERSGLITRRRQAQFRPCHLERQALDAAVDWIEANRRLWTDRFDQLDDHLRSLPGTPRTESHMTEHVLRHHPRLRRASASWCSAA